MFARGSFWGARVAHPADVNFLFYSNKVPSIPDGDLIDNIHAKWFGNYRLLEAHHGFVFDCSVYFLTDLDISSGCFPFSRVQE